MFKEPWPWHLYFPFGTPGGSSRFPISILFPQLKCPSQKTASEHPEQTAQFTFAVMRTRFLEKPAVLCCEVTSRDSQPSQKLTTTPFLREPPAALLGASQACGVSGARGCPRGTTAGSCATSPRRRWEPGLEADLDSAQRRLFWEASGSPAWVRLPTGSAPVLLGLHPETPSFPSQLCPPPQVTLLLPLRLCSGALGELPGSGTCPDT